MGVQINYYCGNDLVKADYIAENETFHRPSIGESIIVISQKKTYLARSVEQKFYEENKDLIDVAKNNGEGISWKKPSFFKIATNAFIEGLHEKISMKKFKTIYKINDVIASSNSYTYQVSVVSEECIK